MAIEAWGDLSGLQHLLYVGALATAVMSIVALKRWAWPKAVNVYEQLQWMMNDKHDHEVIMERLDEVGKGLRSINHKLERNNGSHIPDSLDRIERHMKVLTGRQQAAAHFKQNPVFETDCNGEIIFINSGYKRMFGIDGEDAEGMGWVNIIATHNREAVVVRWMKAVKDKRNFDEYMDLLDAKGNVLKCHVIAYVVRDDGDEILGHHGEVYIMKEEKAA